MKVVAKIIVSAISLLVLGCDQTPRYNTYLQAIEAGKAKYKVGDTIVVDKGGYAGCHIKITKVDAATHLCGLSAYLCYSPKYVGTSYDCPITAASDDGDTWQ